MLALKQVNAELNQQKEDQQLELERLRKILLHSSPEVVADLQKKIADLAACAKGVSH